MPKIIETISKCGGKYIYFGITNHITKYIKEGLLKRDEIIYFTFNVDGVPIYKSSKNTFWQILCNYSLSQPTFLVALFYGVFKPLNIDPYLKDLLNEIILLSKNGITYNKIKYNVSFKAFIYTCSCILNIS